MAGFCKVCGAKLKEGAKFCAECGAKVAPQAEPQTTSVFTKPVQESYEPPVQQSYEPPVQQSYEPPVQQSYEPPVQQSYEPPVQQSYEPPVQQSYEPPVQQSYEPPVQQSYEPPVQQSYEPPVQQTYEAPKGSDAPTQGGDVPPSYVPPAGGYVPPKAPKKKKGGGGKVAALIITLVVLAIAAVVALTFIIRGVVVGKGGKDAGRYDCIYYQVGDFRGDPEGEWVELKKNGKAELSIMGQEFNGKWEQDGTEFALKQAGDTYYGTLENGLLELDIMGTRYFFAGEGYIPEEKPTRPEIPVVEPDDVVTPETENQADSPYAWWDDDFYGWWIIKEAGEDWHSGQEFAFWDVCASIDVNSDGTGYIELWDTDCAADEVFAQVDVYFGGGTTEYGAMMSEDGFIYGHELEHAEWIVDLGVSNSSALDQMMCIDGSFEDSSGDYDYLIFLRPWGMRWEDVAMAPSDDLFFDNMMPAHYEDWYLPLIEDGRSMPEYFEGIVFP